MRTARVVIVTRATAYEGLLHAHGTLGQARFFLQQRGQDVDEAVLSHHRQLDAVKRISQEAPTSWRQSRVQRPDLDRFLFEPEDVVVVVGPDGLVANVARFLDGQRVVGVNPDAERIAGLLVTSVAEDVAPILEGEGEIEARTMVEARTDDGRVLRALNEVFIGHESHQSARYRLHLGEREERQSSSGVIVSTGTGATGWASSILKQRRGRNRPLPPTSTALTWLVREAWPSAHTGAELTRGRLRDGQRLQLTCENDVGGVIFGDGIEQDRLRLRYGQRVEVHRSARVLNLCRRAGATRSQRVLVGAGSADSAHSS